MRARVPSLTWSATIATDAQAWAKGCQLIYSSNGHGENIHASAGSTVTGQSVVDSCQKHSQMSMP